MTNRPDLETPGLTNNLLPSIKTHQIYLDPFSAKNSVSSEVKVVSVVVFCVKFFCVIFAEEEVFRIRNQKSEAIFELDDAILDVVLRKKVDRLTSFWIEETSFTMCVQLLITLILIMLSLNINLLQLLD